MLTPQDRISKVSVTLADIHDIAKWYHNLYLTEIPWRGEYFTWTNKQQGDDRVRSRLDRTLGNDCWMMQHDHLTVNYEDPFISDHAAMLIPITQSTINIKVPFKFFNVWADYSEFPHIVAEGWKQNHIRGRMKIIWYKLKDIKPRFKQLNKEVYKGVTERINQAWNKLKSIQAQMHNQYTDALGDQENDCLQQLESWNLTEAADIKEEPMQFYKALMGTSAKHLHAVNRMVMKKGPTLIHQQQVELCAEVTDAEIYKGLCSIGNEKAPGIDGYNEVFFKKTWPIIRNEV
ncbi:PREDICTED: uncharacterized protein LOC109219468 [Nicotiana attenuata]|uniref:uncharacterized protein LOC109219468 n=1 Tax=Nicotiana attenuata TaxID=49451 RepID=UPI000904A4DF|nr:PREDICTED: uncharacterized protein LOC109219468 [Nicotiana attenuata]